MEVNELVLRQMRGNGMIAFQETYVVENDIRSSNIDFIVNLILRLGNHDPGIFEKEIENSLFFKKLITTIKKQEKLIIILPAFPAKSPNPLKTSGINPDLGEVLALKVLNDLATQINFHYDPGCEIIICSDGRVFNDLVLVSDEDLQIYQSGIEEIITSFQFSNIKTFNLDHCFSNVSFSEMRQQLMSGYGKDLNDLKEEIKSQPLSLNTFNGIHRFIKEDRLALFPEKSKNFISEESKYVAYEVIQRSRAWDKLLENYFPGTLRFSIHPYPFFHYKFGVKLVPSKNRWATPWHNVVLLRNGEFELVRKWDVVNQGAKENKYKERYVYYEI